MEKIVSISCLGSFGRFGNQLFQYAVARKYAERHGARLETPPWVGQRLFGLDDPPISRPLPRMPLDHLPDGAVDVDLFGYFQFQGAMDLLQVGELRRWYAFRPEWSASFSKPRPYYIAAHLRRGDYLELKDCYAIVSERSYWEACDAFHLDRSSLIFVGEGLGHPDPALEAAGLGFLDDFLTLMHADVLLRGNSTFSWWAALLGHGKVFSPLVEDRTGDQTVPFVEGNWPRMCPARGSNGRLTDLHLVDSNPAGS